MLFIGLTMIVSRQTHCVRNAWITRTGLTLAGNGSTESPPFRFPRTRSTAIDPLYSGYMHMHTTIHTLGDARKTSDHEWAKRAHRTETEDGSERFLLLHDRAQWSRKFSEKA